MQTFLPEGSNFELGFQVLDRQRLGKQRVETFQISNVIMSLDKDDNPYVHKGWKHHPAVRMWEGYPMALNRYGMLCCKEFVRRGYKDSLYPRFAKRYMNLIAEGNELVLPHWLTNPDSEKRIIESHRSNLRRKMPEHYMDLWDTKTDLPYFWPVGKG